MMPALRPASHPGSTLRLPRAAAFWVVGGTVAALLAASSAPSPLYPIYQQEFRFSALELTAIFAVYVLAVLLSLLTVGRLSDFTGRRPVLAGALVVEAAAMAVFLTAEGTHWLLAARVVQGLATGAAIGVLGAYLLDLQPADGRRLGSLVNSVAPAVGLGIGALGTGLLVQYGPYPTRLTFALLAGVFAVLAAVTATLPETVRPVPGALASLRPQVAVPARARRPFAAALPTMLSTWALGGLMFSVGGSVVRTVFDRPNTAVVGVVLGIFAGAAAATGVLVSPLSPGAHRAARHGGPRSRRRRLPGRAGSLVAGAVRRGRRPGRQRFRLGLPRLDAVADPAGRAARARRAALRRVRGQLPRAQRSRAGGRRPDPADRAAGHHRRVRRPGRARRAGQPRAARPGPPGRHRRPGPASGRARLTVLDVLTGPRGLPPAAAGATIAARGSEAGNGVADRLHVWIRHPGWRRR